MSAEGSGDTRVQWIQRRVLTLYEKATKMEKFQKAMQAEEAQRCIGEFLDNSDCSMLVFYGDNVSVANSVPKVLTGKTKGLLFLKLQSGTLDEKSMGKEVLMLELTRSALADLEGLLEEVYRPLLSNPVNQEGWGDVASKETVDKLHNFLAATTITLGQTRGETLLPLPSMDGLQETTGADGKVGFLVTATSKERIHLLEGAVITWTKQVKAVLRQDPESLLKMGLHPTPDQEIQFWRSKAANLNSIFDQLQSESVRQVLRCLDAHKSTYCTPFAKLCKEVFQARLEANDNVKFLSTLEGLFDKLISGNEFDKLPELYPPIMHTLLLIWKHSQFYNTPARLVVLTRQICNAIVKQATEYVSGEEIFRLIDSEETSDAVRKLTTTLQVCTSFKTTYFEYKTKANAECPHNPWRIQNNALFLRLDAFVERIHDILDLVTTILQFSKLARIDIGGTKGKSLTTSVQQIHSDFENAVETFKKLPFDMMDVSAKQFDDEFYVFRTRVKELERRLGSVLTQAFDDCVTVYGRFKLLDSFEGLLERPIIADELEKKHLTLIHSYGEDLKTVQELFLQDRDDPPIGANLPPIAGALTWVRGLRERIQEPMEKLRELNAAIMDREEAKEVAKIYSTIMASLNEYEGLKIEEWGRDVEASSQAKLKLPLLRRDAESGLLHVNFDPALVRLLREVKYFLLLELDVPESALAIYKKSEIFRQQTGNLDLVVNMYNEMITNMLPVEKPLVQGHLDKIDRIVKKGVEVMNWKSHGIDAFIGECTTAANTANKVLTTLQNNLSEVRKILDTWAAQPLLERQSKAVTVDEFQQRQRGLTKIRYQEVKKGMKAIHDLVKASNKTLKVSQGAPDWRAYVDFVSNIVVDGLSAVVTKSLQYLLDQIEGAAQKRADKPPMLEIQLNLFNNQVNFHPDIGSTPSGKGIRDVVGNWLDDFMMVATIGKRVDTGDGTYLHEMHDDLHITMLLSRIGDALAENDDRFAAFRQQYEQYSYLWTTDLDDMFAEFVKEAVVETENGSKLPDLSKFDEAVSKYRGVQKEVNALSTPTEIGWLRVDSRPIKQALSTCTTRWVYKFTQYLRDHVTGTLEELNCFIDRVSEGLKEEVKQEDREALKRVMTHIRDVRKSMDRTHEMFDPMRDCVMLLKQHGVAVEEILIADKPVLDFLEGAPLKWDATVNATFEKKEEILPLQNQEVINVQKQVEVFGEEMKAFRAEVKDKAPFRFTGDPERAFPLMDEYYERNLRMIERAREQSQLEELFELHVSKYNETTDTKSELQVLKTVWDYRYLVQSTFQRWEATLWTDIDTEDLEDQCKRLLRETKTFASRNPVVRRWKAFTDLEQQVKNMASVIPKIGDLHSPSMRDRHWKALSQVCNVKPIDPKDPKFSLADLLALNLHEHIDEVDEIVETANKELKIDKKLTAIEQAWAGLQLEFVQHKDTDVFIVKVPDEVIENLEAHQLELQTILGMGRFAAYFEKRVLHWQKTLGTVQTVLTVWTSVTKQWASLESIFLGSADIRSQLPDDTKRFEGIDSDFKDMMKDAVTTPNVVEACTAENREELLKQQLVPALELCQKSLNEYLDVKKKIFPRFYFVSTVALLDMLSNGNNPPRIIQYLGDCFDALSSLDFVEGSTDATEAMVAKDGERVPFTEPFVIQGAVEDWLNDLTRHMQNTLRNVLDAAFDAATYWDVDQPRHKWLFDYPAQVVITGTQLSWTEETERSLEELEMGTEDAVRKYVTVCTDRLQQLIKLVQGQLAPADRTKIIALITMDVHARDVVQKLVDTKAEGVDSFQWAQQLRYYWQPKTRDIDIRITDFRTKYSYEYIGNTGRLVITPLTDRCYITLTMAMRLMLGGAPAGPAGTGKTETTKDLARALALPCYVFNCSDQMNYQTLADIFKGLAQAGSWGCFDEFNRISIEVLSVVATQVKSVLDAIKHLSVPSNREEQYQHLPAGTPPQQVGLFELQGDTVGLVPTVGFFITMNPGYAGRTELPENLKALFRSCAMIRPDLEPICENMLMAEGFVDARPLAVKFVTLYQLSSELLSPQVHYDWGLRSAKAVLRVAGTLKRAEPGVHEEAVLMRALRDFNTPKMPLPDVPIFLRLIEDLFPRSYQTPRKVDEDLRSTCIAMCKEKGWQSDEGFISKVIQFQELLDVRHSVMILGPAGCGKTAVWKGLLACHNHGQPKPVGVSRVVNPKAVTSDELYGFVTLSKDWKDGVISIIMRGMSKNYKELGFHDYQNHKWVVLDGDIDAVWIESMNTVMDDNKVLTLVSNERVPLSDAMRMVFEINSLANAMPSTVSRAGILYINETDIGWRPYVESWMLTREVEQELQTLPAQFEKYIDPLVESMSKGYKAITPVMTISKVVTVCRLLEGLLGDLKPEQRTAETIEHVFAFSVMWAFGGSLSSDKTRDYRRDFSADFGAIFSHIKFPQDQKTPLCFDYFFDAEAGAMVHWESQVPEYSPVPIGTETGETLFGDLLVQTIDTVRLTYLLQRLQANKHPVMMVGAAGTGKTSLIREYIRNLDEGTLQTTVNMNYFMDSQMLQLQLENAIEKRSGSTYGPPPGKRMLYFVDDINLPYIEEYGTQNSLELLRQVIDHKSCYNREDLGLRMEIADVQFVSAMNPTAGSFLINARVQRHFSTFAAIMPEHAELRHIYHSLLEGHLASFPEEVSGLCGSLVDATVALHDQIASKFLPSAIKFVYNWSMRELSNVFGGVCSAKPAHYRDPTRMLRLWLHEAVRVYSDRLIFDSDMERFREILADVTKKHFADANQEELHAEPLIFTSFHDPSSAGTGAAPLLPVPAGEEGREMLKRTLEGKLEEHNDAHPIMSLVLFQQAVEHVCRICRILDRPGGNAMLIGVGGSGKQSLSRLAAFIGGFEVKQLQVSANFKVDNLKEALQEYYRLAGVKGTPLVFLVTDAQIIDEQFLVYINDILNGGWIPDLFEREDFEGIFSSLRNEAKANGVQESPDAMLEFFLSRVVRNLHVVLAFSPVGDVFRVRARRFPGIINCTVIDWFHAWPQEALVSVAEAKLRGVELGTQEMRENVAHHMAEVHMSVTRKSEEFKSAQRRFNYVTPKSFLELISFYIKLLGEKRQEKAKLIDRLDVGLSTLRKTAADVAQLQEELKFTLVKVEEKKQNTEALLEQMGKQRAEAEQQNKVALVEREKAAKAESEARAIEEEAEGELAEAKPAMERAGAAVDVLDKASLTELKSLPAPPAGVDKVTACCLMMVEGEYKDHSWSRAKKMMNKVDAFLQKLKDFDAENMSDKLVDGLAPLMKDPALDPAAMAKKSQAAANISTWALNVYQYNRIYVNVKPLMDRLEVARANKAEAEEQLAEVEAVVKDLDEKLQKLQNTFMEATNEKAKVEAEAQRCQDRLALANRLVNGLSSENERWGTEIESLRQSEHTLVGDVLLAAAFVGYVGGFDHTFRESLWRGLWVPDLEAKEIPLTPGVEPLQMLADEGKIAKMKSQGLPADPFSVENGAIVSNCDRWPLMIDPQNQGIKWLRQREEMEGSTVVLMQLTQKNWQRTIQNALSQGSVVIIENLGEEIDATLDPVLAREISKKSSRSMSIQFGGEEVEYDPGFKLFLQTKLSNPHYKPEVQAQCTMINFIATEKGLEEQLLARVVNTEKPELEASKQELQEQENQFKIQLLDLENQLLERLANAPDDILSDVALIEGLEATKKTAKEIAEAVAEGKKKGIQIGHEREVYRPMAMEGAMMYFMIVQLSVISHMYQYSLDQYVFFFYKSIERAQTDEDPKKRVEHLRRSLRIIIYAWISRGLAEQHKLIVMAQLTFNLMRKGVLDIEFHAEYFSFLLRPGKKTDEDNPLSWLPTGAWYSVRALGDFEDFGKLPSDIVEAAPRFREWFNHVTPETEKLPLDWAQLDKTPFLKMLVLRCLRPDRMTVALSSFVRANLPYGDEFVDCDATLNSLQVLDQTFIDSTPQTPIYFILSPGADVVSDMDRLATKYGFERGVTFHNVSMGQGQDKNAMEKLEMGHKQGHWVMLNNVHLMPRWLRELEKKLDEFMGEGSHEDFRVFLTSEPADTIPIGILNRSIKLANEPPTGLKANLKRAMASFDKDMVDEAENKTRAILFGLCHFHAIMIERKKFGPKGFNMMYPFSLGDLRDSVICLQNYMEREPTKIPWEDLRYLFGQIMYGGHIVNDFDRLLCMTYLDFFMKDELLDETELFPFLPPESTVSFKSPQPSTYDGYMAHINETLPGDTPLAFGLHPNAEIDYRTTLSNNLFNTLGDLQPHGGGGGESAITPQHVAENVLNEITDRFGDRMFPLDDIESSIGEEKGPFQNVFMQECEQMNTLLTEVKRSLNELSLGFAGELTMSDAMEQLMTSLFLDRVPGSWSKLAWPSRRPLALWLVDWDRRLQQLAEWTENPMEIPRVTWLSGLINPQSFLTAIMQQTAQRQGLELDKLVIFTDVTKKVSLDEVEAPSRDGALIHGLSLEGARWDLKDGTLEYARPREMFCPLPVINARAVSADKAEGAGQYNCPVYKTEFRGPTYVFSAQLRTKSPPSRWILAGVAIILDIVE